MKGTGQWASGSESCGPNWDPFRARARKKKRLSRGVAAARSENFIDCFCVAFVATKNEY